ncbi:hypothetical protein ABZ235_34740, partial [Streptomyces canus]
MSARRRVRAARSPTTSTAGHAGVVRDFKEAWQAKDIGALVQLLDPNAVATSDGGGLVTASPVPLHGGEPTARFLVGPVVQVDDTVQARERPAGSSASGGPQHKRIHKGRGGGRGRG